MKKSRKIVATIIIEQEEKNGLIHGRASATVEGEASPYALLAFLHGFKSRIPLIAEDVEEQIKGLFIDSEMERISDCQV